MARFVAFGAGASLAFGCGGAPSIEWHDGVGYRWSDLSVPRRGVVGFRQLPSSETGIEFSNSLTEERVLQNQLLLNGSGVALGDVDGDGLIDVYLSGLDRSNVLYRNLGRWRFEDITERAGIAAPNRFSTGSVFADVDGDGDLDLLTTAMGGPNALFINDGSGVFVDRTEESGLTSEAGSMTMALADVDGDADLDLYVGNYKARSVRDLYPPDELAFDRVIEETDGTATVRPEFREHYGITRRFGRVARIELAEPDRFYLNDGTGRFEHMPFTSGRFLDEMGVPLEEDLTDWALTVRFQDVDLDGDPDLYVCNDFESPDRFWINDGSGRFRLVGRMALRRTSGATMTMGFSDLDRDGDVDFMLLDMLDASGSRRKTQTVLNLPDPPVVGEIDNRPQLPRNTLMVNRGDGTFAEAAYFAGVEGSGWSWSVVFLDVDLDGYEDILISNGYAYDFLDLDTMDRIQASMREMRDPLMMRERRFLLEFPPLHLRNVAFRNKGDLTFEEVGEEWGFGPEEDISQGMAAADLDLDGDVDLVTNRLGQPAGVFQNETNSPRIAVRLRGEAPNVQGIGARISVLGGPINSQQKEATLGLYLSSSDPQYSFATGEADSVTIVVEWRSGVTSQIDGAIPNRVYEVFESGATAPSIPESPESELQRLASAGRPLFRDVGEDLGHSHVERDFDDRMRQPLLRHRLSQLGPGITWSDVDRDGDEDLLITSGAGGRLSLFRNDRARFTAIPLRVAETPFDQTMALPIPSTEGRSSFLVGQMNYEASQPAEAAAASSVLKVDLSRVRPGTRSIAPGVSEVIPGEMSSTGPLALADFDNDGDLDLFVGGRVLPARYPAPASSRLFLNDEGRFILDSGNSGLLAGIGLVSGAVFSDVDVDGDPDLILALDWGSLKLFINDAGQFMDATSQFGLETYRSMWNGITTGDLNGDGLPDIVATSWGRNTKLRASLDHPMVLYHADFDQNGVADIVEAQYDETLNGMAPLRSRIPLNQGIPFLSRRIATYHEFAEATVNDLLGPSLGGAAALEVNTLDHTVFFGTGSSFEAHALPDEAQLAPAFSANIADFDGDGHEDLFVSQNFFANEPETGRYDAGRGLLLLGDGSGGLRAVPGQESGIAVYGDQRSAAFADYDGDARIDLAVSQNGAETKLFHNVGAEQGIRIRLVGPQVNPDVVGGVIRIVYPDSLGPAREIHSGSGFWSQDGPVQVLGLGRGAVAVRVRWPDGSETEVPIEAGQLEISITYSEDGASGA